MKNSVQISCSLRRVLAMGAIAISAAACAAHDSNDSQDAFGDPNVVAKLRDVGLQASSGDGVPSPTKMYAVEVSDHQAAETALGASAPPGASVPQGSVLSITLDAATYDTTDWGVSNVEPDLSRVASARVDLLAK
ncbi:MAG TPA: hypothetical protein VG963_11610 [Polyangiaceae bacterium]|nr:hypothetical protein [Polyangiaceae bacterium]